MKAFPQLKTRGPLSQQSQSADPAYASLSFCMLGKSGRKGQPLSRSQETWWWLTLTVNFTGFRTNQKASRLGTPVGSSLNLIIWLIKTCLKCGWCLSFSSIDKWRYKGTLPLPTCVHSYWDIHLPCCWLWHIRIAVFSSSAHIWVVSILMS